MDIGEITCDEVLIYRRTQRHGASFERHNRLGRQKPDDGGRHLVSHARVGPRFLPWAARYDFLTFDDYFLLSSTIS